MKIINLLSLLILCYTSVSFAQLQPEEKELIKNYSILYNVHLPDSTGDNWEIMHMNPDGSGKLNITKNDDVAWTYYAYKDRLFFISDRDTSYRCYFLYETDCKAEKIRKVSELRLEDSWMSSRNNGSEMIVSGRTGKDIRYQLFIINLATGSYTQFTNDTSAMYFDPCFSPDGKKIVFSCQKNKWDNTQHEELFIINADGSGMTQLTTYPENNPSAGQYGYKAGAARWHPTENYITYVSKQDGKNSIFAVSPDGKKQWKLTANTIPEGWHDWSSDGKWLCFNSSDPEETQFDIFLMNWGTKKLQQLTDNTYRSQLAPVFIEK
jgi:TolB protein